jgi:lysophospholipase L1-like esterase
MPNVVRFALSTARTLTVPGAGTFINGILDVDATKTQLLARTRYLVSPFRAVELGVTDATTPYPTLPATGPGDPDPDPYPQYLTDDAARAAYGLPAPIASGRAATGTAVVLGDSNTARPPDGATGATPDTAGQRQAPGWFQLMCMMSKGAIRHGGLFARSGYTTAQVRDLYLSSALALDVTQRGAVFIMLGTNDISAGSGASFDLAASTTAYVDIVTQVKAAGSLPVVCIPIPCSAAPAIQVNQQIWNRRLRQIADYHHLPVIDFYTPLLDPATGGIVTAWQTDTTHANNLGRRVMASAAIAQGVTGLFPPAYPLTSKWSPDPSNAVPNGLFLAGSGTGWATDGTAGTITYPTPTVGDKLAGQWQEIAANTPGVRNGRRTNSIPSRATLGWAVGDTVEFTCRVQTEGVEAAAAAALNPDVYVGLRFDDVANTTISFAYGLYGGSASRQNVDVADGLLRARATIPVGCENFRVYASVDGADATHVIKLRFGEVTLRNLTALGTYVP